MKTSLYQKFNSFEELNSVSDNTPFSHRFLRYKLMEDKAKKQNKGEAKWAVHAMGKSVSYSLFIPQKCVLTNKWSYVPFAGTGYSKKNLKLKSVQRHLPKDWNGESGLFHNGELIQTEGGSFPINA